MGYTGRNSVSQHVEDWRQGKLLEDALSPGGDGVGRGARGVMGAQRHRPSSPAPRSSLRAEAGEVVRQTVALSVPPEKRTEEHVAEIVAVLVNVFENDFLPLYPESVQRELCRRLRLESFQRRGIPAPLRMRRTCSSRRFDESREQLELAPGEAETKMSTARTSTHARPSTPRPSVRMSRKSS
jgi:hypothetical protein